MTLRLLPLPRAAPDEQQVCALFADVVGSTRLAAWLPTGHYAALMTEVMQLMMLSLETGGGLLLQHQGDAVISLWNAGESGAAARAGQALHGRLTRLELARALGVSLRLRVGLSVGAVVLGELGGRPNAYGLPLNLARRLCSQAVPGETLACAAAATATPQLRWQLRTLGALAGLQDHHQGYRLCGPQGDFVQTGAEAFQMKSS